MKHTKPQVSRPPRLPPLNLFRAFEASARHLSFTLAAEELLITQSAVSQQIRQLEEFLDVRLFRRLPRKLELTREAIPLAGAVHEAMALISRSCAQLSDPAAPTVLCVNAAPAFASRWLAPRLGRFMERHPNVRVTLLSSSDPVDFNRQDVDVAIRWGDDHWPANVRSMTISEHSIVPVCSPSLLNPATNAISFDELKDHRLLQVINQPHWMEWLDRQGMAGYRCRETLYFSDASLMIEAALQGQGLCLASSLLVADDVRQGKLAMPFPYILEVEQAFHLLSDLEMSEKPKIAVFRDWVTDELALDQLASSGSWTTRPPTN